MANLRLHGLLNLPFKDVLVGDQSPLDVDPIHMHRDVFLLLQLEPGRDGGWEGIRFGKGTLKK